MSKNELYGIIWVCFTAVTMVAAFISRSTVWVALMLVPLLLFYPSNKG